MRRECLQLRRRTLVSGASLALAWVTILLFRLRSRRVQCFRLSMVTLGIVRSIAAGATDTPAGIWAPYFVLEWLDGESLENALNKRREQGLGGLSLADTLRWLDGPSQALAFAHENRIAHRDIKPANFFVLRKGGSRTHAAPAIKLLDFGIAKPMEPQDGGPEKGLAALGFSAFSPRYAAPEQVNPIVGLTGPWPDELLAKLATGQLGK